MNVYWYICFLGLQPTRKLYNMIAVERSGVTMYLTKVMQLSVNINYNILLSQ